MMIYTYLQRMDPDRLARVLGDPQLAQELPELAADNGSKAGNLPGGAEPPPVR